MSVENVFVGVVASDPKFHASSAGDVGCEFRLAVRGGYRGRDGVWVDQPATFFTVQAWGRGVRSVRADRWLKGLPVIVVGRFETSVWVDREGVERSRMFIKAVALGENLAAGRGKDAENTGVLAGDGGAGDGSWPQPSVPGGK